MIAVQRDAIVADAERDATNLIGLEVQTIKAYFSNIGTQAALLGGFAFNLFSFSQPDDADDRHHVGVFYFFASLSVSLQMIAVVYSSVVSSRAATMGLTGAKPSEIRHTVVLMRQDQRCARPRKALG